MNKILQTPQLWNQNHKSSNKDFKSWL